MIYIVDIEAHETRYTGEWKLRLPMQLQKATGEPIEVISGDNATQDTTPGAFINFNTTNKYKAQQIQKIAHLFEMKQVKDGDYFLYTDAWNPTVLQLKYMAQMNNVKITIGGMWHAGSYDPNDFLGREIGDENWIENTEMAMFESYDDNFFATQYHIDLFANKYKDKITINDYGKISRVGWPLEYLKTTLKRHNTSPKENLIVFPHRITEEKQPDIFRDLATALPEYKFVFAQEQKLSKTQYHNLLGRAKMVFSANLQETLGISWYEGLLCGAVPLLPNRCSYSEIAPGQFLYPSQWTINFEAYKENKSNLVERIKTRMENYMQYPLKLNKEQQYFDGYAMYCKIRGRNKITDRIGGYK